MAFQRNTLFEGRTLAWRLFKRHHTHFNETYWSHRAALKYVFGATGAFQPEDATSALFPFTAGDRRIPTTLGRWGGAYSDFDLWIHMASIVAICGYLETYIAQAATAALESNPTITLGGGPTIDGAIFLKVNPNYGMYSHVEGLVRGDWHTRAANFSRLFGTTPFTSHISDLERLRKLRNDAGHSFGRDIKKMRFAANWMVERVPRIKEADLQDHLAVIDAVASGVEAHLAPIVGQYEIIKTLHMWLPNCKNPRAAPKDIARLFSVHINTLTGSPYGKQPGVELIEYYRAL